MSKGTGGLVSIVSYSRPSLMIIALRTQFHVERPWGQRPFCLNSVLNVKALVGAFNKEKALVGAFSVIVQRLWNRWIVLQHYRGQAGHGEAGRGAVLGGGGVALGAGGDHFLHVPEEG